ncbi:MAG: hypothetical protein IJ915_05625 [Paludibacteraceae bacterium]|nr:hypothetical protein [Paludibacteraceae bacterium]
MKKIFFMAVTMLAAVTLGLGSCGDKNKAESKQEQNGSAGNKIENELLTPDESKEKLMAVAKMFVGKFNTQDQKAVAQLADNLYGKYESYDLGEFENHYKDRYDVLFGMPRYVTNVLSGRATPLDRSYVFSFSGESAIFEANDKTHAWEYKGKASDNSLILRCTDNSGKQVEAKVWGEGAEHELEYSWVERGETHTAKGKLPAKIVFTLRQGNTEHMRVVFTQELVKNNHAFLGTSVKIANLSWTADMKVYSTKANGAFKFVCGSETLLSAAVNLPSFRLIDKQDSQSYEDWVEEYGDRYEEILKSIGSADAAVDILGWVQLKANIDNFSYLYRDGEKNGLGSRDSESQQKMVESINSHVKTGLYYGSDIKQAQVIAQLGRERHYDYDYYTGQQQEYYRYFPEGVLYFPEDKTTYGFDQYFDRKPFTDLQYTVEDLANKYIQLSKYLYEEVGTVEL